MTRTFRAPGRVNLIGEHTDYTGGLVLPVALDLGVNVEGEAADRIRLASDRRDGAVDIDARGAGAADGWGRYVATVASELDALGRPPVGFAGRVSADLPIGAGLSSSAALEVAVATALCAVAEFAVEPLQLALAAQRAEHRVGVPCGIMDQAVVVLARAGHALLLDTATLEHDHVPLPAELALVIVDSGVRHALEDSGYADRRRELEAALAVLGGSRPADVAPDELPRDASPRLRHVVTENARVREVVRLLRAPRLDRARLGEVFREGHESLRDDFEVSTRELDRLVELAYQHGAVAARMTGGGFGGSIVALVDADGAGAFADAIVDAYGVAGTAYVARAAAGAREVTAD